MTDWAHNPTLQALKELESENTADDLMDISRRAGHPHSWRDLLEQAFVRGFDIAVRECTRLHAEATPPAPPPPVPDVTPTDTAPRRFWPTDEDDPDDDSDA